MLDSALPRLSRLADNAKLWVASALVLARFTGPRGELAARRGLGALSATSAIVNLVLKPLFRRRRPALEVVPRARRLARLPKSASLPSGHAASAFAFTTAASLELPAASPLLAPLATAVAFSRIYTGVHYPSDVAAGSAVGVAVALLARAAWPPPAAATPEPGVTRPGL